MIKDMLFGESYNPLIVKAYQGDTLIFERETEHWDYELSNIDFGGTAADRIYTGINPFSTTNISKDWDIVLKAETDQTAEGKTDIGLFSRYNTATPHYNLELGIKPNATYIDVHGHLRGKETTYPLGSSGKEVQIFKRGIEISIYVDKTLIWVGALSNAAGSDASQEMAVGGCTMGSTYHFLGHLYYFKFRWTTKPIPQEYDYDYIYRKLVFKGNTSDVIQTNITPFDSTNINKNWKFSFKVSLANRSDTTALAKKMYVVCNTTTTTTDPNTNSYWAGTGSDDLTANTLCIFDPGLGLGVSGGSNGTLTTRLRGADHATGRVDGFGTIYSKAEGVDYAIVTIRYDKTMNYLYYSLYSFDENDQPVYISGSFTHSQATGNNATFSTSNLPIIIGGCYYDQSSISIDNPTFNRVMGTPDTPVTMEYFKFKYL